MARKKSANNNANKQQQQQNKKRKIAEVEAEEQQQPTVVPETKKEKKSNEPAKKKQKSAPAANKKQPEQKKKQEEKKKPVVAEVESEEEEEEQPAVVIKREQQKKQKKSDVEETTQSTSDEEADKSQPEKKEDKKKQSKKRQQSTNEVAELKKLQKQEENQKLAQEAKIIKNVLVISNLSVRDAAKDIISQCMNEIGSVESIQYIRPDKQSLSAFVQFKNDLTDSALEYSGADIDDKPIKIRFANSLDYGIAIRNVATSVTEEVMTTYMQEIGPVESVQILGGQDSTQRVFRVVFKDLKSVVEATGYNGADIHGRPVRIIVNTAAPIQQQSE